MTETEAKRAGMMLVGEWGASNGDIYGFWCRPEQRTEVQSTWDAIEEGELLSDVLADMEATGAMVIKQDLPVGPSMWMPLPSNKEN